MQKFKFKEEIKRVDANNEEKKYSHKITATPTTIITSDHIIQTGVNFLNVFYVYEEREVETIV